MNMNTFHITFRGQVKQGWDREDVKANMAGLFKLDPSNQEHVQKINRMFSGRTVVIKEGINKSTAQAYVDAIDRAGGEAQIKIKIGPPDGIEERRISLRRKKPDRRTTPRLSAILPDRRESRGRRDSDLLE